MVRIRFKFTEEKEGQKYLARDLFHLGKEVIGISCGYISPTLSSDFQKTVDLSARYIGTAEHSAVV